MWSRPSRHGGGPQSHDTLTTSTSTVLVFSGFLKTPEFARAMSVRLPCREDSSRTSMGRLRRRWELLSSAGTGSDGGGGMCSLDGSKWRCGAPTSSTGKRISVRVRRR